MLDVSLLRPHQRKAIEASQEDGFQSGVHFHATGTGKSWVALYLLAAFIEAIKSKLVKFTVPSTPLVVFWICERKSILQEQFDRETLQKRGFHRFLQKSFQVVNFSEQKNPNWYESIHAAKFWGKPILVVINRAYLTSGEKYRHIKLPIHLVLHDECHSISNETTQTFYQWLVKENHPEARCLGFSATPCVDTGLKINPFQRVISQFTIYQACVEDDVIVPPLIEHYKVKDKKGSLEDEEIAELIKSRIQNQPYQKMVVWAGMIHFCESQAELWQRVFPDFKICIDTSLVKKALANTISYEEFYAKKSKAILFCACKHREGSDIPNLDTCVFLDAVESRGHQLFVQCVGRVLRRDAERRKTHGLILDIKAKSTISVCDRLAEAFQLPQGVFPWKLNELQEKVMERNIGIHQVGIQPKVSLSSTKNVSAEKVATEANKSAAAAAVVVEISAEQLSSLFIRDVPTDKAYQRRLTRELKLITKKNLGRYLCQAMDILEMTQDVPHITRGSCGSSLVCYLLGISHVDPIRYGISFARFLNECRDNLPDIDFDFPYNQRDIIFLKLQARWPGKIARISNHVHYHEKSARREAIRRAGIQGFISKHDLYDKDLIASWDKETRNKIEMETNNLLETFRCYSLHCGGIVYYEEGVPQDVMLEGKKTTIQQVTLDKHQVSGEKRFKIDILSSRGLAQLTEIHQVVSPNGGMFQFNTDSYIGDEATCDMLARGDNLGITLAESTLMRKAFVKFKPKTLHDMAICLSIVRPAASQAKQTESFRDAERYLIFDDDAIHMIRYATGCREADADRLRRMLSKPDASKRDNALREIRQRYREMSSSRKDTIDLEEVLRNLEGLRKYSFCKSHAYSYAQLVWALAYMKAHHPTEFWIATLNHCQSQHRKWVHRYEAYRKGVDWRDMSLRKNDQSIYAKARDKRRRVFASQVDELKSTGFWDIPTPPGEPQFFPNCFGFRQGDQYRFRGVIANMRVYRNHYCMIYLGIGDGKYIEAQFPKKMLGRIKENMVGLQGHGILVSNEPIIIDCEKKGRVSGF